MSDLLQEAITLAKAGNKNQAERLFRQLLESHPKNVGGWIWLERVVDDTNQKKECLQKILEITPENQKAKRQLEALTFVTLSQSSNINTSKREKSPPPIRKIPPEQPKQQTQTTELQPNIRHQHQPNTNLRFSDVLDDDQLRAVNHRGSNLLIIAGAGSGKTRTLTFRAISLLDEFMPENLMIVTFTKKAAKEILDRITSNVSEKQRKALQRAWIGTIHSVCWRMLMENGHLVHLQPNWSVLDMADSIRVMGLSAKPYGIQTEKEVRDIYQLYSFARNSMMDWRKLVGSQRFPNLHDEKSIGLCIESYQRKCHRGNRIDFDDLQVLALKLIRENLAVRNSYKDRFRVIMIDEYQDTNQIQRRLFDLLADNSNITVVGDDSQAIYGFRAATVENILNFKEDYQAEQITIRTNYRSTPEIVNLSNASIANNKLQIKKSIRSCTSKFQLPKLFIANSPTEEAAYVIKGVTSLIARGVRRENISILFRASRQVGAIELELRKAGIPYIVVGGEDFFSLEHIKVTLDMVRLLVNPEDTIALSSVQSIVGFSDAEFIDQIDRKAEKMQLSLWTLVEKEISSLGTKDTNDIKSLLAFHGTLEKMRGEITEGESILPIVTIIINFLSPFFIKKYSLTWNDIKTDLGLLADIASTYKSLNDLINTLAIQQFQEDPSEHKNKPLVLSTIHSAKGLEWDAIFVIGLVEFWFPLNLAIQQTGNDEEERRLFYVAVTRARKHLYLTSYSTSYNPYGKLMPQVLSRFIRELPSHVYQKVLE